MGGWGGGQAEDVMVPYADFNLLKFPGRARRMAKIKGRTRLTAIWPTATNEPCRPSRPPRSTGNAGGAGGKVWWRGRDGTVGPGGVGAQAQSGTAGIRIGLGGAKSPGFTTGQCPVMRYHRGLMQAILHDKIQIAKAVNATVISLDEGPQGYKDFDKGAAKKYVIDPHKMVARA